MPTGLEPDGAGSVQRKDGADTIRVPLGDAVCSGCHKMIDPLGLPFENYDAVGEYRTAEHWTDPRDDDELRHPDRLQRRRPGVDGSAASGVDLVKLLASSEEVGAASPRSG